jgi:hypothetical protein
MMHASREQPIGAPPRPSACVVPHLVLASARRLSPQPMAPRVGCGVQTVRPSIPALNTTGLAGMSKPSTRPKRVEATLNATPAARLQHRLHQAPRTYGTPTGVWTLALAA